MKKSQILAALALAFALGVAAPAMTATTYATDDQANVCTGTSTDLSNAIANVTGNATYQAYEALDAAKADVVNVSTVTIVKNGQAPTNNGLIANITRFTGSTPATTKTLKELTDMVEADVKLSINGEDRTFAQLKALVDAINDTTPSDADEIAAIKSALTGLGFNADNEITTTTPGVAPAGLVAATGARLQAINAVNTQLTFPMSYTTIATLVDRYDSAIATEKAFKDYKEALLAPEIDLTNADKNTVRGYTTGNADFTNLDSIYTNVRGTANWFAVRGKITAAKNLAVNDYSVTNICTILSNTTPAGLLQLMRTATNNPELTYVELVNGQITVNPDPEQPGDDTNNGSNEGNGSADEDKGSATTPDDGALAKAEGGASASASIMAAIATVATAAGAAFIAIRRKIAAKKEA